MFPTYTNLLTSLVTYIKPTEAGAKAHADALIALTILELELSNIIIDVSLAGVPPKLADYADIGKAISAYGAVIGPMLVKPSSTATTAAISLNQVRMHATRAIGAKTGIGNPDQWKDKLRHAMMDLELATARAIADADQRGEIA